MYKDFANIYDFIMNEVPYDEWAEFIRHLILKYNPNSKNVLDAACGTGNLTFFLKDSFNMSGFDISPKMLKIAKLKNSGCDFWEGDLENSFNTDKKFDAIVCIFDSINYLNSENSINIFFKNCKTHLKKGGILIFDIITINKIKNLFRNNVFTYEDSNISYIWYNKFINRKIFLNDLTFFIKNKNNSFKKIKEKHKRRLFDLEEIFFAAEQNSFSLIKSFDGFNNKINNKKSERILFLFKEEE